MDPRTGMIADLVEFQNAVDAHVVKPFDHTFLNKDIPYFAEVVPTAENIAVHIRDLLREPINNIGASLHKVKLIERPNNSAEVYCEQTSTSAAFLAKETPKLATV